MSQITAKPLPDDWRCELCGAPMRSLPSEWLARHEYIVECTAGCWPCADCGGLHRAEYECNIRSLIVQRGHLMRPPASDEDFSDDLPF